VTEPVADTGVADEGDAMVINPTTGIATANITVIRLECTT
jgi:hypothetical protein